MASNPIISDENRNKRKKELKNEASENLQSSEKMDLSLSERFKSVHKTEDLEKVLNDTSKEINTLLSKYAHILSYPRNILEYVGVIQEISWSMYLGEISEWTEAGLSLKCDRSLRENKLIAYPKKNHVMEEKGIKNIPVIGSFVAHQKQPQITFNNRKGLECISSAFSSVEETPQAIPTKIKGHVPKWLKGKLLRNGPGKFEFGKDKYAHWFDGMALLHQFEIDGSIVKYRSRFLRSDSYMENSQNNRIMVSEFGTMAMPDPCKTIFERFMSRFEMPKATDNCSVNFVVYKGDYYVSTETNLMHKVDLETLESKEKVNWRKYIAVNGATAHPHYDPDGTAYNMGNSYGNHGSAYNIIRIPPQKTGLNDFSLEGAKVLCTIAPDDKMKPSYYHSFGMSENYVIFIEQPLKMNLWKFITAKSLGKSFLDGINWEPQHNTRFHVVNKLTGEVLPWQYYSEPFLTFHQINAFEDQGCIVFDLCCTNGGNALDIYRLQNLRKAGHALDQVYNSVEMSYPRRFVLPLNVDSGVPIGQNLSPLNYTSARAIRKADGKIWCTHEQLHDEKLKEAGGLEFPQINYARCSGKKYQFFYGCGFGHLIGDSLIKTDIKTKEIKMDYGCLLCQKVPPVSSKPVEIWREDGLYPSEPVFVPEPNSSEEDSGIILSVVITPKKTQGTFLLILDAKNFTELGRAEVPVQIPYGFHGIFVPQEQKCH